MSKAKASERVEAVRAWGTEFGGICLAPLAERHGPTSKDLLPPNSRSVRVRIIRESDYRKLLRAAKPRRQR